MSDVGYEVKKTINDAIKEYNKFRIPEIKAKLISINGISFNVEFTGSFCESCGFYDYFDDFSILLEDDYGLKTKIIEINEISEGAVVKFEMVD
jgi:superoxide reductase